MLWGNAGGLFRAAMGDSPSLSFLPSYNDTYTEGIFKQFANFAGCTSDIMKCLRTADGNKLALAGSQTIAARTATLFTFAPILDGTFLRERPVEAFKNGHFAQVPVLFGSNTNEGAGWSASLPDASANTSMPNATETTVYNFLKGQFADLTRASFDQAVTKFYPLSDYGTFSLQGQQMYGEMRYICTAGLITGAAFDHKLKAYQFQYVHDHSDPKWIFDLHASSYDNPVLGSNHGADLAAFFPTSTPSDPNVNALFVAMREFWTSFVATSQPSAKDSSISWKAVANSNSSPRILLHPGATNDPGIALENLSSALSARCAFWHGISAELKV
ncbi:hypothetical protein DXG01_003695 [Tephrocybe rancida]|nr:hypothetical protein DXG01_003695 [Tephrocybe rancida]